MRRCCQEVFLCAGLAAGFGRKKCKTYDFEFAMLGVISGSGQLCNGVIVVKNKPERVLNIVKQIDDVVQDSSWSKALASELKGKCQFASNQI